MPSPDANAAANPVASKPAVRTAPDVRTALVPGAQMSVRIDVHHLRESSWFQSFRRDTKSIQELEKAFDAPCGFSLIDSVEEIAASHSGEQNVIIGVRISRPAADIATCLKGAGYTLGNDTIGDFGVYTRSDSNDLAVVVAEDVVFLGSPATLRLALLHRGPQGVGTGELELGEVARLSLRAYDDFDSLDGILRATPDDFAVAGEVTFHTEALAKSAMETLATIDGQLKAELAKTGATLPSGVEIFHTIFEGRTITLTAGSRGASDGEALMAEVRAMARRR